MDKGKFNLDVADLEIERLDVTADAEEPVIEAFTIGGEGHGMTEIGASCNSCCSGCNGSVKEETL